MGDNARPRKRGRENDDSYHNDNRQKRREYNNGPRHYDRRPYNGPRRDQRPPPRPSNRLTGKYLHLADGIRDPLQEIDEVVNLIDSNFDDSHIAKTFCELTVAIISEQPLKIVYIAAAIQALNVKRPELVQEVLNSVAQFCQLGIEQGDWRTVKITLRLLACLQGLYNDDGVITILEELFQRTIDLQTASPEDVLGIEFVKIILLTIPYLMISGVTGLEQRVAELLEKTDIVASAPHPLDSLVDPFTTDDQEERPMACPSVLSILQKQLQSEAGNGWQLSFMPRILVDLAAKAAAEESAAPAKFDFPNVVLPEKLNPGERTLFPEVYFSIFADQDIESVAPTSHLASSVIRDVMVDTMNLLEYNRIEVAKFLISVDSFFAPKTFVKRATAYDKLKTIPEGESTWKPEDMLIDAAFSQIMQLPEPEHRFVYYHSVIFAATQQSPSAIAPSLGRAIRYLYRNLRVLDMELGYRYMDWFSHHVSNFDFRWKWTEWLDDINNSDLHSKKAFIVGAIDKEIRLSFPKRIAASIPEEWSTLISEGQKKDQPDYKFDNEKEPYAKQGQQVHKLLRNRESTTEDMQAALDEIGMLAAQQGVEPLLASTDVFMTAICHVGSASKSHVLSAIEKNKDRLLAIGPASETARRQIISAVVNYWQYQKGTAVTIISILLNYTIITPMSVIEWCLHDHIDRGRALSELYIYELVSMTMAKVTNRVRQIADARIDPKMPAEQREPIEETLVRERQSMRDLFTAIEDSIKPVAEANNDEMVEAFDGKTEESDLLQLWGSKWLRVWRRKAAIEEAEVGETALVAREEVLKVQAQAPADAAAAAAEAAASAAAQTAEDASGGRGEYGNGNGEEMDGIDDVR